MNVLMYVPVVPGRTLVCVALVVWAGGVVAIAKQDSKDFVIPSAQVWTVGGLTATLLALAAGTSGNWSNLDQAVLCAAGVFLGLLAWAFLTSVARAVPFPGKFPMAVLCRNSIGMGDVRLAAVVSLGAGAVNPVRCITALCLCLLVTGSISYASRHVCGSPQDVAVGPFLAAAGLTTVVSGAF